MTETEHLHLKKMGQGDYYSVDDFNANADIVDAKLKEIDASKGQPGGIATLDGSGKLAQMPTAADVGAMPHSHTRKVRVPGEDVVPHYDDANNYRTPGQRISFAPQITAQSVDNLPEANSGQLCVYGFDSDTIYQTYETFFGRRWIRQYIASTGVWSNWNTHISSSETSDGNFYINFGIGFSLCSGSQTWENVSINNATQGIYASQTLFFSNFKRTFSYAPKCLIGMSVGAGGPYWLTLSSNGPTTARPQGFKLMSSTQFTVPTITISYIAVGVL